MFRRFHCRHFAKNDVGICTAEAERIYPGDEAFPIVWKGFELSRHAQLQGLHIDMRAWISKMEDGRDLAVLEHQHAFDQAYHASSGF